MRGSVLPLSVAGLGVVLCLASPASATTYAITPPSVTPSSESGDFTNYYTFTLTSSEDLSAEDFFATIGTFKSGTLALYSGSPTSGTLVSSTSLTGSPFQSGDLTDVLGAGAYYYEAAVKASGLSSNILAVAVIPELQTWAMLGLGFAALGFVGFAKRKGEPRAFVD